MWGPYAEKFRELIQDGADLGTEARFLDMLLPRASTILDVGCGTGSTVAHLRAAGHAAYGIDPMTQSSTSRTDTSTGRGTAPEVPPI